MPWPWPWRALLRPAAVTPVLLSFSIATPSGAFLGAAPSGHSALSRSRLRSTPSPSGMPLPPPVAVPPGSSPVEDQQAVNPIDASCTVLVVGANRGIGLEFARQCVRRGATVVASFRSDAVPTSLRELRSEHPEGQLHPLHLDLESETSIVDAASACRDLDVGALTHVIHSAGIYLPGTSFDGTARGSRAATPKVTKEVMQKTFEINTIAPLLIAQHFLPLTRKRSGDLYPVLAFLGSKVGSVDDNGSGGAYAYRASKSALNNVAKSLSVDLADDARVVLLHPGYVRTDMTGGKGLIDATTSVEGMLRAVECTDARRGFRFVDYKACLIPW